jgi:pimeloyl-ACP methyl ester carboxylesterase
MGAGDASQFTRNTVKVDDLSIPYFKGGRGQPLLYLHGLSGWGRWESYHMALGITNMVYAPQLPGWPEGQIPANLTSVRDYAQAMLHFLDAVAINTVDLVGHSFGGWLALQMAVAYPERISKLVLADPMGVYSAEAPAANLATMDEEAFLHAAFARSGVVVVRGDFGGVTEDIRKGPEFEKQWQGREIVAKIVRGHYADPEMTQQVSAITASTLIVWGREDGIVPWRHGQVLAEAIPRAKFAVIDEAGHTPMREKRETFQRIVRNFLIGQEEEVERSAMVKG